MNPSVQREITGWPPNKKSDGKAEDKDGPLYSLSAELRALLNLARLPGRLTEPLTAALLGFKPHHIPVLVARGFLQPLGRQIPGREKFFARKRVLEYADNEEWLSRATEALSEHWQLKNARKSKNSG
jgi:hypothetical protein